MTTERSVLCWCSILSLGACGSVGSDSDGSSAVPGEPVAVSGALYKDVTEEMARDFRTEFTIDSSTPIACTRPDCSWAFATEGRYSWIYTDPEFRLETAVDQVPYDAQLEYLRDYAGYHVVTWVDNSQLNGDPSESNHLIEVTWTDPQHTVAVLSNLPAALGGCPNTDSEETCTWSGNLQVER